MDTKELYRRLRDAGIPGSAAHLSFSDHGAPKHLQKYLTIISNEEPYESNAFILDSTDLRDGLRGFMLLAKETIVAHNDVMYLSLLQLIAKLSSGTEEDAELLVDASYLFIHSFYVNSRECPLSPLDKALLSDFLLERYFRDNPTNIMVMGDFLVDNTWYDPTLLSIFEDHLEWDLYE